MAVKRDELSGAEAAAEAFLSSIEADVGDTELEVQHVQSDGFAMEPGVTYEVDFIGEVSGIRHLRKSLAKGSGHSEAGFSGRRYYVEGFQPPDEPIVDMEGEPFLLDRASFDELELLLLEELARNLGKPVNSDGFFAVGFHDRPITKGSRRHALYKTMSQLMEKVNTPEEELIHSISRDGPAGGYWLMRPIAWEETNEADHGVRIEKEEQARVRREYEETVAVVERIRAKRKSQPVQQPYDESHVPPAKQSTESGSQARQQTTDLARPKFLRNDDERSAYVATHREKSDVKKPKEERKEGVRSDGKKDLPTSERSMREMKKRDNLRHRKRR